MWKEIVAEVGAQPVYVLATRNPNEVAGSLFARGRLDPVIAELLWLEHNFDALLACRNDIAAIVDYQEWIDRPVPQARYLIEKLGLSYAGSDEELAALLAGIIAPELRHHEPSPTFRLPFTAPLYQMLLKHELGPALQLADIFNASRKLTNSVAGPIYRNLLEQRQLADARARRIAELEAQAGEGSS